MLHEGDAENALPRRTCLSLMTSPGCQADLAASLVNRVIEAALVEDVGSGDITSEAAVDASLEIESGAVARQPGVMAGIAVFGSVFRKLDPDLEILLRVSDGANFSAGETLAEVVGSARSTLTAERVALNFLQRMCGIATETAAYVKAVDGTGATILDTRKTVPGLRMFDKYSVRMGGGENHRMGLFDAVMIKDNHIAAAGSIHQAVTLVRCSQGDSPRFIEVECDSLDQVAECLELEVDLILLDNMCIADITNAVKVVAGRCKLEVSGGVTLEFVREIAQTGVDYISVGSLTHSVVALDIGLDFGKLGGETNG